MRRSSGTSRPSSMAPRSTGSSTSRRRSECRLPGSGTGRIPVVLVNRYVEGDAVDTVVSDNRAAGARSPRRCSTWGTAASRSSPDRRTRRRAATESMGFREGLETPRCRARRDASPCRAVQPPQRLPVGPRPSRVAAAAVRDLRGQRPHRLRRARRGSPHRDPRPRRPLGRRLRRHRHGGLGGVQPDDGQAAPREDGTGGRRPAARADRRRRAMPRRPVAARSPSSSSGAGRSRPPRRAEAGRGGLV